MAAVQRTTRFDDVKLSTSRTCEALTRRSPELLTKLQRPIDTCQPPDRLRPTAMSSAQPPRKLRVLCLHGFRTNDKVMESQVRGVREALGNNAEFVFLNGPFESRGPTDEVITKMFGDTAPFYEWWAGRYLDADEKAEMAAAEFPPDPKIWNLHFEDIDQSLEYVDEQLQKLGEFDIALGFSQGAAMLTMLSMWYHTRLNKRWWKLVICVCGVRVQGINMRELFETAEGEPIPIPFPSIHIAGKKDSLYTKSLMLRDMYAAEHSGFQRTLIEHDSGHKFPSPARNEKLYEHLGQLVLNFFAAQNNPHGLPRL